MAEMRAKLGLDNAEFNTGLAQAKVRLKEFNEALSNPVSSLAAFGASLPVIGGVIGLIQVGIGTVKAFGEGMEQAFHSAMKRQELIADFQAFYGSVEASTAKIKEFSDYARHTSFSTDDVAEGALRLEVLTNGAIQGAKALHMVGDVATDTEESFTNVATTIGVLYSRISSGGAIERPLLALEKMGVVTPVVSAKIKDMIAAGTSTADTWKIIENELKQFEGTTENVAATASGSLDKIRKNTAAVFTALSMPVVDALTPWLKRAADQSDTFRTRFSSWGGIWKMFISGAVLAWFKFVTGCRNATTEIKTNLMAFQGLVEAVTVGAIAMGKALYELAHGDVKGATQAITEGWKTVQDSARETGEKINAVYKASNAENVKDAQASAASIIAINNGIPAPDLHKTLDFDPEYGEQQLKSKQQELANLEAEAREKSMTDLEKINDMQARRNDLLAKAAWWQDHINSLDPAHDQGAITASKGQMVDAQVEAARLAEQIGQVQETREQKITELKQRILEKQEAAMSKQEEIAALEKEQSTLDLNNTDEEIRLKAQDRDEEIKAKLKELEKGPKLEADALRKHGGGIRGVNYSQILGSNQAVEQTKLQAKMESHLAKISNHMMIHGMQKQVHHFKHARFSV